MKFSEVEQMWKRGLSAKDVWGMRAKVSEIRIVVKRFEEDIFWIK